MKSYACSYCGAKAKDRIKPPSLVKTLCPVCGKPLVVKISDTEVTVTAKLTVVRHKRREYGQKAILKAVLNYNFICVRRYKRQCRSAKAVIMPV